MKRNRLPWDRSEIAHLKMWWLKETDEDIAKYLGRSAKSVRHRRWELKLLRTPGESFSLNHKLRRMKELIALCEANPSPPIKDGYKRELMKLSGLW